MPRVPEHKVSGLGMCKNKGVPGDYLTRKELVASPVSSYFLP